MIRENGRKIKTLRNVKRLVRQNPKLFSNIGVNLGHFEELEKRLEKEIKRRAYLTLSEAIDITEEIEIVIG